MRWGVCKNGLTPTKKRFNFYFLHFVFKVHGTYNTIFNCNFALKLYPYGKEAQKQMGCSRRSTANGA